MNFCKCLLSFVKFVFSYDYNQMLIFKVFLRKVFKKKFYKRNL